MCACMWKPEVDVKCLPCEHSFLFRQDFLPNLELADLTRLACPEVPLSPPPECWDYRWLPRLSSFSMGSVVLHSISHAYTASTSSTEPSPQLQGNHFKD